jgi:hypothetical protein
MYIQIKAIGGTYKSITVIKFAYEIYKNKKITL